MSRKVFEMLSQVFFLRTAAILGALAVTLGAFAAHGLKDKLPADMLEVFKTGVQYHFYHAIALLALAAAGGSLWESRLTGLAALAWLVGIVIFSGTLYLLAFSGIRWLGAITPLGGVAFIVGWVLVALAAGAVKR